LNVFGRYTRTFCLPRFDTILGNATIPGSTATLPVSMAIESEAGVKWALPWLQVYAVGFMSKFNQLTGSTQVADPTGAITTSAVLGTGTVGDATVGRSVFGRNFTVSIEKKF